MMTDFAAARRMMVDGQVRTSDVTDLRLIGAMLDVPREKFVPPGEIDLAYSDLDLPAVAHGGAGAARALLKPLGSFAARNTLAAGRTFFTWLAAGDAHGVVANPFAGIRDAVEAERH